MNNNKESLKELIQHIKVVREEYATDKNVALFGIILNGDRQTSVVSASPYNLSRMLIAFAEEDNTVKKCILEASEYIMTEGLYENLAKNNIDPTLN
jgi:predicted ATP-grasp superfamily ATP-dependent carboligase